MRKRDYHYASGEIGAHAGDRLGSSWLNAVDTSRLFCSMRCAARYGIRTAEKRVRGDVPPEK
jgi:hypothetical protein